MNFSKTWRQKTLLIKCTFKHILKFISLTQICILSYLGQVAFTKAEERLTPMFISQVVSFWLIWMRCFRQSKFTVRSDERTKHYKTLRSHERNLTVRREKIYGAVGKI